MGSMIAMEGYTGIRTAFALKRKGEALNEKSNTPAQLKVATAYKMTVWIVITFYINM